MRGRRKPCEFRDTQPREDDMPAITKSPETLRSRAVKHRHSFGRRILDRIFLMTALARQRRHLRDLPDHLLKDIGLTREAARAEAERRFWDAPTHWKR